MNTSTQGPSTSSESGWRALTRRLAISNQRRRWGRVAGRWDHHGGPGLNKIVDAVVARAQPGSDMVVLDIGAGTGAVSLPLAPHVAKMIAVDVSAEMITELEAHAARAGLTNVEGRAEPVEDLRIAPASLDLVVSNYALHHLLDRDKDVVVGQVAAWLRPGGRLVIGDMMLGRGATPEDRAIIASKIKILVGRGPGGWWRVAKNAWRYLTRTEERPISMQAWEALLVKHGFTDVRGERIVAEGAVVSGTRSA